MDRRRSDREAAELTELVRLRLELADGEPYAGVPSTSLSAEQLEERINWYGLRAQHLMLQARQGGEEPRSAPPCLSVLDGGGEAIAGRAALKLV